MELDSLLKENDLSPEVKQVIREKINENRKLKHELNQLMQYNEFFKTSFEKSPIGIELYDEQRVLISANKACLEIFGVPGINDVIGFKLLEDPSIPDKVRTKLFNNETIRFEVTFDFEKVKYLQLSGTSKSGIISLDITIIPLINFKEQHLTGYLVQIQDITAQKFTLEEIKEREKVTEQKYQMLVETMDAGVLLQDVNGYITFGNPSLLNMMGLTSEEIIGKGLEEIFGKELGIGEEELQKMRRHTELRLRGFKSNYETEIHNKDGKVIPLLVNASPFLDSSGDYSGVISVITDISEQKKLLYLQERFIAITSHELRTPLTVLKGFIEFLHSNQELPIEKKEVIFSMLFRNVTRLIRLIDNVHDLSKITNEVFSISPEKTNLDEFVQNLQEEFYLLYPRRAIIINYNRYIENSSIFIDKDRILQLLHNLVSNAIKNSHQTSIVNVLIVRDPTNLRISVQDTGSGISFTKNPNLFQPFSYAETPHSAKGTGLGLYIVKVIVEKHNGMIEVLSQENVGTIFTVII